MRFVASLWEMISLPVTLKYWVYPSLVLNMVQKMVHAMENVVKPDVDLIADRQNLISVGYNNVIEDLVVDWAYGGGEREWLQLDGSDGFDHSLLRL